MREDLRSWLVCLVGLAVILFFAFTGQDLDPYWMVLLGGMIGVTVIAGSVRRNGRKDDDDTAKDQVVEPVERVRPPRDRGGPGSSWLRVAWFQAAT